MSLVFRENAAKYFAGNCRKSPKIVVKPFAPLGGTGDK
jgi:hypothetical protein